MALKFKLKSKDEAPAELQPLYVERDGAWVLDVEGAVEKARLDEARTASAALLKERATLVRGERRRGCGGEWAAPGGAGLGKNPFRKESWNLTEQMKLMKTDPPLAARTRKTKAEN